MSRFLIAENLQVATANAKEWQWRQLGETTWEHPESKEPVTYIYAPCDLVYLKNVKCVYEGYFTTQQRRDDFLQVCRSMGFAVETGRHGTSLVDPVSQAVVMAMMSEAVMRIHYPLPDNWRQDNRLRETVELYEFEARRKNTEMLKLVIEQAITHAMRVKLGKY